MGLFRKIGGGALVAAAALGGNWLGDTMRATTTGEQVRRLGLVHTTPEGQTVLGLNVALTNFVPRSCWRCWPASRARCTPSSAAR